MILRCVQEEEMCSPGDSRMLFTAGLLFSWLQFETSESSKCDLSHGEVEAGGLKFEGSLD